MISMKFKNQLENSKWKYLTFLLKCLAHLLHSKSMCRAIYYRNLVVIIKNEHVRIFPELKSNKNRNCSVQDEFIELHFLKLFENGDRHHEKSVLKQSNEHKFMV